MGFLSLFGLGEKPRTPEQIVPTIDLARGIACDLGREDTRDTVRRRLGAPTETRSHGLLYEQIGLFVNVTKSGRVTGWSVMFSPQSPPLTWIGRSGERRTGEPPLEADVLALLGPPTKRETDDEELMLTWEQPDRTTLVDYAFDGTMNDVFVDFT